ncbi:MAG TPA: aminopeptidase P N-terminal domain-containing protein, partial [Pyrinomonadaceae bacterium]|nr:aminopeptidase P N-terminal domain-containing protein [Pyrinomonadaceae bacterium]
MRAQLKKFIDSIGPDAIAIVPAAHEATRSYDTEYKFRQDSDFLYLTGFPEPDAIAVIDGANRKHPYSLYVRPRNLEMETWFGRREGVEGAVKNHAAGKAH